VSTPKPPAPAKLLIGLFMKDTELFEAVSRKLLEKFGSTDMISAWLPFDYTSYYAAEMGEPLFRRMLSFEALIPQDRLADIKLITNGIEKSYSEEGGSRKVNIDPGYLLLERFVLATGKNYTHRIYIGQNIYADLTLIYQQGAFRTLPWTYPDYADEKMLNFLKLVRSRYAVNLKERI
jgi:hypothetical protein